LAPPYSLRKCLKGGFKLFSPLGEYGFSREGFAFVILTLLQVLSLFQMLYCTSTVAFGATSLKGGFKLFSPLGEYGFSREGFALRF